MRSSGDRRRLGLIAALTAFAAGPAAGALAQTVAPADKPPVKDLTVMIVKTTNSKQSVQATLGSYCLPSDDGTYSCKEIPAPLPNVPRVKVNAGETISLLFKSPVGYVTWRTARVNGKKQEILISQGEGDQVTKTKKRWKITLPKTMKKNATIVGVFAQYVNAYASFEFGIDVKPAKKPAKKK
ncbi:hypothetical protein DSM112329_01440 [Paraconexibacter sp. AEG42_29]|uniref:Uncharacterized protein n=1 Tax=Paraconexibacter sp. AEG42_29 TaxID=2997339 RepID=A0AAU7ASF1_9ACTN